MTNTLIVIGAGHEPDQYLREDYERIILIEPHPRLAESLRQKTADNTNVRVEELAVVTDAALNQLHEFNLPEVASVRQPTGLKHLLAGLRHKMSHPVATLPASELCKRFELSEEGRHKLVVQANGEEVNIILGLIESSGLDHFQQVMLGARRTAYYDGEQAIDTVTGRLQKLGFEMRQEMPEDTDWPLWAFEINPLHKVVEALKSELEERKSENTALRNKQKEIISESEANTAKWSEKLDREKERADKHESGHIENKKWVETLGQEFKQYKEESEKLQAQLSQEKQSLEDQLKLKDESIRGLQRDNQRLQDQLQKFKAEVESIKHELSKQASDKEENQRAWEDERAQLCEHKKALQQELQQYKERAASMERTNSMQTKLLTKLEIDSQDLRSRYADLQKRERELTDLIKELHGKLELASGFFRQLQNEHPELIEQY